MSDRRRINGPASGTAPPVFVTSTASSRPSRERKPNELRKIFLRTGVIPSTTGSAYLELALPPNPRSLLPTRSTIKLSCSVHGPKPVGRNASFSPNLQLAASIKFAPFATHLRRGYVRDATERDLGVHLENALKGVIIPDRWPKSAIEIAVIVLEGEDGVVGMKTAEGLEDIAMMNVLSSSITVAMAALADARIDCLDVVAGGVAAVTSTSSAGRILDPSPLEHEDISAACVVAYLPSRDEITELWVRGEMGMQTGDNTLGFEDLMDSAVGAARGVNTLVQDILKESAQKGVSKKALSSAKVATKNEVTNDAEMQT